MTQERIDILNELDFVWDASSTRVSNNSQYNRSWWKRYEEVKAYLRTNTFDSLPSDSTLGQWVHRQRQEYESYSNAAFFFCVYC
jgi:hypothetical protein